jgi:uncharacterized membrane protein
MMLMHTARFWEIDFLRGMAVVLMVTYHIAFNLTFFGGLKVGISTLPWVLLSKLSAGLFIFLVGVSLNISWQKRNGNLMHFFKRGALIFLGGMAITVFTYVMFKDMFVVFGILHLIGASVVLGAVAMKIIKNKRHMLAAGITLFLIGTLLSLMRFDFAHLMWLGLIPNSLNSLDFYPLLPWFGMVMAGIGMGSKLYTGEQRLFKQDIENVRFPGKEILGMIGRNSLVIYFLHQPVIIMLLFLAGAIQFNPISIITGVLGL